MADAITDQLARHLVASATARGLTLATVESCTGGLISATLTGIPGASAAFTHGFVTYANKAKRDVVGVPQSLLDTHGAVSAPVAGAMAVGGQKVSHADIAVSVTGIAGPGGGTVDKPVGLVFIGVAPPDTSPKTYRHLFPQGSRQFIRLLTVRAALRHMLAALG
ncbi:MAG: CinA family protein [Pseudomonadota bacterium]